MGGKKKFGCNNCKYFVISLSTEKIIMELDDGQKKIFVEASQKCREEDILLIYHDEESRKVDWRCEPDKEWS